MLITLGITHYNRTKLFKELMSKLKYLPNTIELCIVDDFSEIESYNEIVKFMENSNLKYKIYRHDINKGPGAAKNSLFENSNTEYVFVLDSDNAIDLNSLQYIINYASEHKSNIIAPSAIQYFYKDFKPTNITYHRKPSLSNFDVFLFGNEIYNNGNMLISKEVWKNVGGYPIHHTLDTQGFAFRLRANGYDFDCVPGASYFHRHHKNWSNSRFLKTSESGKISIEQLLILIEYWGMLPYQIQIFIYEYPIFNNSAWDNSLFSGLSNLIANSMEESISEIESKDYKNIFILISNYLNSEKFFNKKDELNKVDNDFIKFIVKIGSGFLTLDKDNRKEITKREFHL